MRAQDLEAWARGCKVRLSGWEFETLLNMSYDYWQMKLKAESPNCPPPWSGKATTVTRAADTAKRIKSLLRS